MLTKIQLYIKTIVYLNLRLFQANKIRKTTASVNLINFNSYGYII